MVWNEKRPHRDFPQLLSHHICEAGSSDSAALFPAIVHSNHPIGVFYHVTVAVGVDAGLVLVLVPDDNDVRTSPQHFIGLPLSHQIIESLPVRNHGYQFQ